MEGAEAHAETAQCGAGFLIETADVFGHIAAVQEAEILDELERDAARHAGKLLGGLEIEERLERRLDLVVDEALDAGGDLVARGAGQLLVGEQDRARAQRIVAGRQRGDGRADPAHEAIRRQREIAVRRCGKPLGARFELSRQRFLRGGAHGLGVLAFRLLVGGEAEALELAHMVALDEDLAGRIDFSFKHTVFS